MYPEKKPFPRWQLLQKRPLDAEPRFHTQQQRAACCCQPRERRKSGPRQQGQQAERPACLQPQRETEYPVDVGERKRQGDHKHERQRQQQRQPQQPLSVPRPLERTQLPLRHDAGIESVLHEVLGDVLSLGLHVDDTCLRPTASHSESLTWRMVGDRTQSGMARACRLPCLNSGATRTGVLARNGQYLRFC